MHYFFNFQSMIWHLIRYLVSFSLPAFYKKIQGKNIQNLQVKGPVVIAMNHPNAFMDPVCITWVSFPQRLKYMARGDAFKPGLANFFLTQLGIVPIFRLRDGGKEGLQKNDESYRVVNKLLKRNNKIIIFAEGLCIQERRLRPLKKGVSRMVFGAYDYLNNKDLIVVPVGVNYSAASKFRSKLFYNVGAPIKVSDFAEAFKENPAKTHNQFLQLLDVKMKELVTHINNKENDELVVQLEEMVMKEWSMKLNLSSKLEDEFKVTSHLTDIINHVDELDKPKLEEIRTKTSDYYKLLKKHNLRDWLINPLNNSQINRFKLNLRLFLLVLGLPIHTLGYLAAYMPYKLTEFLTKKLVRKNVEFYASISVGLGSFIFLFNFLLWFFFIYIFSPNVLWPLNLTALLMGCAWFSMIFHFYIKKTMAMKRLLATPALNEDLKEKRQAIMALINGLTNF